MHQEWLQTDGELTIVFGKKLVLLLNPNAFYEEFSVDTIDYERFIEGLDNMAEQRHPSAEEAGKLGLYKVDPRAEPSSTIEYNRERFCQSSILTLTTLRFD
ncbi:MAG: hypothetical protein AB1483_09215 [Candidatus Zixiibacteriota bacterium]